MNKCGVIVFRVLTQKRIGDESSFDADDWYVLRRMRSCRPDNGAACATTKATPGRDPHRGIALRFQPAAKEKFQVDDCGNAWRIVGLDES